MGYLHLEPGDIQTISFEKFYEQNHYAEKDSNKFLGQIISTLTRFLIKFNNLVT